MKIKVTIKQNTRSAMRHTLRTLKVNGYQCKAVDNGSHLTGSDRWSVVYFKQRETLTVPRKPKGDTFANMNHSIAHSAPRWLKSGTVKSVNVYQKSNRLQNNLN